MDCIFVGTPTHDEGRRNNLNLRAYLAWEERRGSFLPSASYPSLCDWLTLLLLFLAAPFSHRGKREAAAAAPNNSSGGTARLDTGSRVSDVHFFRWNPSWTQCSAIRAKNTSLMIWRLFENLREAITLQNWCSIVGNNLDCNSWIFHCPFVSLYPVSVIWEMIGSQSIDTPIGQCFTFEGRLLTKLINHGNPQNTEKMSI